MGKDASVKLRWVLNRNPTLVEIFKTAFATGEEAAEVIEGRVIIATTSAISYQGIKIVLTGTITLQPSLKSVGVLESLYTSIKPIQLLNKSVQVEATGTLNPSSNEIPFRLTLDGAKGGFGGSLPDTYHGAYINIQYVLTAEVSRGYMLKALSGSIEIILEGSRGKIPRLPCQSQFVYFYITQDTQKHSLLPSIRSGRLHASIDGIKSLFLIEVSLGQFWGLKTQGLTDQTQGFAIMADRPDDVTEEVSSPQGRPTHGVGGFRVTGRVLTHCCLTEPVVGEVTVEHAAVSIRSIDLTLLRIESITLNDRTASEMTEVQATQVADGDVCRGLPLPIYLFLPRLLTCPTLAFGSFSLEFGLAITITFEAEISKFYAQSDSTTPKEWRKYHLLGTFVRINFGAVILPKFCQTGAILLDTEKRDEEGSSSHGTERVSHEDALFKAQLVSFMETFQLLSKHPKMQELLQASKNPTQTQKASSQSLQSPRQSRSGHLQRRETSKEQRFNDTKGKGHVVEQPPAPIGHRQPSTHGLVNVFQAMIRPSPALHGFMPDNAYGAMPPGGNNPMYGNIGVQPGFQCAAGSYGMPGANMGMAGFSQPDALNLNMAGRPGGNFGSGMPLLNAPAYDNLTPKGKPKDYMEGGQAVKFDTFHGTHDKLKDLLFLQQFDAAFAGGNFTESSRIRKAATFLKTNALQW
ncbi:hypothetical protein L7F22_048446 [Adiantum nelumboides]|nr:hypothetical protein [Adiantum nelumboides]